MDASSLHTVVELLESSALMGFGALLYSFVAPRLSGRALAVALGLLFGIGAIVVMIDPLEVAPGLRVDSRTSLVLVAGLFGGPLAATIAGALAALYRLHLGGAGALVGVAGLLLSVLVAAAAHRHVRRRGGEVVARDVVLLAATAPLLSLPVFLLPWGQALAVLSESLVPATVVRFCGVVFLGLLLLHERRRLEAEAEVRRLAFADDLSGLANRRAFFLQLDQAWQAWRRYGESFTVMVVDVDRFKLINDRHGHPAGDEAIRALGRVLAEEKRAVDVAARIGGEEFALLLPRTAAAETEVAAERVRRAVEGLRVDAGDCVLSFTVSIGIGADAVDHMEARDALASADRALYAAKEGGRNRVVLAPTAARALHGPRRDAAATAGPGARPGRLRAFAAAGRGR